MRERGEAMMIYNVSPVKGMLCCVHFLVYKLTGLPAAISQAGKRNELLAKIPSKEGDQQVQWIWEGMLIEWEQYVIDSHMCPSLSFNVSRYTLRLEIRALGQKPSSADRTHIEDRKGSLQTKIEAFHQQALRFASFGVASIIHSSSRASAVLELDLEDSDEETFFFEGEVEWEEDDDDTEVPVENIKLWLPSSFTASERIKMGLGQIAKVEAELREGQANDALEALRDGLAEKSLRFRTEVKPAKSQKTMTRAWDSIHRADKQIRSAVLCYRIARNALKELGVADKVLQQYQEIDKKDLKMSRDIVEENRVGQRSSELPWFWRLDNKWDKDRGEFLKECKYYCLLSCVNIGVTIVFQSTG
jgi:hypothetical protein